MSYIIENREPTYAPSDRIENLEESQIAFKADASKTVERIKPFMWYDYSEGGWKMESTEDFKLSRITGGNDDITCEVTCLSKVENPGVGTQGHILIKNAKGEILHQVGFADALKECSNGVISITDPISTNKFHLKVEETDSPHEVKRVVDCYNKLKDFPTEKGRKVKVLLTHAPQLAGGEEVE